MTLGGLFDDAPWGPHFGLTCAQASELRPPRLLQPPAPALVNFAVRHPGSSEREEQAAAKKQQMGFHGDCLLEL